MVAGGVGPGPQLATGSLRQLRPVIGSGLIQA